METENFVDIFGSLTDFQSFPYLQQMASPSTTVTSHFSPISCNQESAATMDTHHHYGKCSSDDTGENSNKYDLRHPKRKRTADMHNMYERRRRDRIRDKMNALRELIPHCHKQDRASMLDDAINYIIALKLRVQMLSNSNMGGGALCRAPCLQEAASYFSPLMLINPTLTTSCENGGVPLDHPHLQPSPLVPAAGAELPLDNPHPHLQLQPSLITAVKAARLQQTSGYGNLGSLGPPYFISTLLH